MEVGMFEILKSGGVFMIPIALCAVLAVFIIVERFIFYYSIKKTDKKLLPELDSFLTQKNYDGAIAYCKACGTPLSRVLSRAIQCRNYKYETLKETVMNEATLEIKVLEHFLTPLGTIANISTLLGLLGTVTGNISAFGILGEGGTMGNPAVLAGAISEALVTTASGLFVSIPALIFHNYFVAKVNKSLCEIESISSEMVIRLKKDLSVKMDSGINATGNVIQVEKNEE